MLTKIKDGLWVDFKNNKLFIYRECYELPNELSLKLLDFVKMCAGADGAYQPQDDALALLKEINGHRNSV